MRFTHFSDSHIGSWRDEKMSQLCTLAFKQILEDSISKNVDFVLIAGDLFNTALPPIDKLKDVVIELKKLHEKQIPCYVIPGSHDFSASGKTMIEVLEHAGLLINVCKGSVENDTLKLKLTEDRKSGAKITGIIGKKGMLDRKYYEKLDRESLEKEQGFKIFMFHTAITELKPKDLEKMDSAPLSLLPKGFDYYAGGHVHIVDKKDIDGYRNVIYPGALFPNSFREIEEQKHGGYFLYEDGVITFNPIILKNVVAMNFDCNNKTTDEVQKEILQQIKDTSVANAIVTVRLQGTLHSGKISDIPLQEVVGMLYHKGAYFVMRSTSLLRTKDVEIIHTTASSVEEAENTVITENKQNVEQIKKLMQILSLEKMEGETKYNYEKRIIEETNKLLE